MATSREIITGGLSAIDTYEVYQVGTTNVDALTTIAFDTERDVNALFSLSAGVVTLNQDISSLTLTAQVTLNRTNNSRTKTRHYIYINGVQYAGSLASGYHRTTTAGEDSPIKNVTVKNLTSGDTIEVRSERLTGTAGNLVTISECSNMIIQINEL